MPMWPSESLVAIGGWGDLLQAAPAAPGPQDPAPFEDEILPESAGDEDPEEVVEEAPEPMAEVLAGGPEDAGQGSPQCKVQARRF